MTTRSGRVASIYSLQAMEIVGQDPEAAGQMGVGNLGQAKFGHALFLQAGQWPAPIGTMGFEGASSPGKGMPPLALALRIL